MRTAQRSGNWQLGAVEAEDPSTATANASPSRMESQVALSWSVQLRWLLVGLQAGALLAGYLLELPLPYGPIAGLIGLIAATNIALPRIPRSAARASGLGLGILTLDTLTLTALLALSGGPQNPFSAVYVIYVAFAAMVTPGRGTWWIAALATLCYAALFPWHLPLHFWHAPFHASLPLPNHLLAMWLALAFVAAVITYFIDRITRDRQRRERDLTHAREVAVRNERLASLATLAAGAAHELATPLATIAIAAREIERSASHEIASDAQLIRGEVDRCREILDRMSASSDGGSEQLPAEFPVDELIEDLRAALGPDGGRLRLSATETPGFIRAPRREIFQALLLLIQNALDASPADADVELRLAQTRPLIRLELRDQGTGMPPEVLSRAGEPFFTTKEPGQGTGLGLHVVRLIAERLGGSLDLYSRSEQGTMAVLIVPRGER